MEEKVALIVADDTTGANASGILLKSQKLEVLNCLNGLDCANDSDVDTVGTASRAIDAQEAYDKVFKLLNSAKVSYKVYNKRIDSTLRGNIGPELDAFFDYFEGKRKAIIVASFPDSERLTNRGQLYVNDILLENTEIARDPKMPINSSDVKELFEKNSKLKYKNMFRRTTRKGDEFFKEALKTNLEKYDAIILDATTNFEIDFIARNIADLTLDIICVDPGPFTQRYTYYKQIESNSDEKNLYVIGSVVDTTLAQLDYISQSADFKYYYVDVTRLFNKDSEQYLDEIAKKVNDTSRQNIVFATLDVVDPVRIDLNEYATKLNCSVEDVSNIINNALAKLTLKVLAISEQKINNIFTSGGDISVALLDLTKAQGLKLIDEIIPLCVHSQIIGGQLEGINLITKGGAIGTFNTYEIIAEYMEEI